MDREGRRALFRSIVEGVESRPGHLEPALRRAAVASSELPPSLAVLADKIRTGAAAITDDDLTVARGAHSDDQLFELTVATALGESARRLDVTLRLLGRGR